MSSAKALPRHALLPPVAYVTQKKDCLIFIIFES